MDNLHNVESEKAFLGSLICNNASINEIVSMIKPDDFYSPQHAELYTSILDLYNKSTPIDIVTLHPKHDIAFLTDIVDNCPVVANVKQYAKLVKGKSIRRQHIKAAYQVIDMATNGEYDNVQEFRNDVMQKMDIEIKDKSKNVNDMKNVVTSTMDGIRARHGRIDIYKNYYGLNWLDKKTGGTRNGELTILAARPSIGKTTVAMQIALNKAMKDVSVAVFNLEMTKEALTERILGNKASIDGNSIRYSKNMSSQDWEILKEESQLVSELPLHIYDDVFNVEEIRAVCRELKNKNQLDYIVIDYLQLCDTMKKTNNQNEKVTHLSRQFKLMTKEFNIPILLLSQLSRANEKDNRDPKLIDLRESGAIEQDADNVFLLHDDNYGKYEKDVPDISKLKIIIGKQRNGQRDIYSEFDYAKKFYRITDPYIDQTEVAPWG